MTLKKWINTFIIIIIITEWVIWSHVSFVLFYIGCWCCWTWWLFSSFPIPVPPLQNYSSEVFLTLPVTMSTIHTFLFGHSWPILYLIPVCDFYVCMQASSLRPFWPGCHLWWSGTIDTCYQFMRTMEFIIIMYICKQFCILITCCESNVDFS